jgi:mannose-6-phosphate isomerase-like protein (cupin superfamily)
MKIIQNHNVKSANYGNMIVQDLITEDKNNLSFSKVKLTVEQKLNENKTDVYHYVLEGEGALHIENKKVLISKGDLLFVPKNTKYIFEGELTLLVINYNKK